MELFSKKSLSKILIIVNYKKGYDIEKDKLINIDGYDNYCLIYNLKKNNSRYKYRELLNYAYKNLIEIELYYRNGWSNYYYYGCGIITNIDYNTYHKNYLVNSYEINIICKKIFKIEKCILNCNSYPYVTGCLIHGECDNIARQYPGIYLVYN